MNNITTRLFQTNGKITINRLFCLFALLFMSIQTSWSQTQNVGEFPAMNGGFETAVPAALASATVLTGTQLADWKYATAAQNTVSINSTTVRSGAKSFDWLNSSTSATVITPTAPAAAIAASTSYVVQFYWWKNNVATARANVIQITGDATANLGTAISTGILGTTGLISTVWTKSVTVVTTTAASTAGKYGFAQIKPSGGSGSNVLIDDYVIYAGSAADITAPTAATLPSATLVSGNLVVSWTGAQYSADGGGYVIVRNTTGTVVTLNANGIYGVGNTSATGGGTVVAVTAGIAGTSQSFTDTGLAANTTYYYSIFAVDKAFNCATAATCNGTTGLTPPILTADSTLNNVDNNIDITYPADPTWLAAITAVKIGGTALTLGTDYNISTAGVIQLLPSGLNMLLTTSGSKAVTVEATGYAPASVSQLINPGAPVAANCTATIGAALASGTTQTITITARDQYNNLVPGYGFIYDAAITNANVTTSESYTIDGIPRTTTVNDAGVTATTNASGVATFTVTLPATIDGNDGISIQVQMANGITNVGSAFTYTQLPTQTITFGALAAVTYGDANFNLTATASSGLTVTYTSSNTAVATVSGNTVTIVGAGSTNITASQAGNGSWAAATPVVQALTVNPKALTVTGAVASNKTYTGTNPAVITGATLVGIVGADVVTVSGGGTFVSVNVGTGISVTAALTLGGANAANYTLTQPTGLTANITLAIQVITFPGSLLNYVGFVDFTPPATSPTSGTNPITYTSSNPAVATIVANKVHYIGIGTTTITASQAASANYSAAANKTQTLTVIALPIAAWNVWTSGSTSQTSKQAYLFDAGLVTTSSADFLTRGAGVAASGGTSAFRTIQFPTNAPTAPPVTAGSTQYFQVTLQAATAGSALSLSTINAFFYDAGNGYNAVPGAISQFGYSLDGGTTVVPIGSPVQSTALRMTQIDVSGVAALQDVPAGTTITLRYYSSGYAAQGWGFGSPNPTGGGPVGLGGIAATDGLVIGGDVSATTTWTTGLVWTNGTPDATKNAIILGAFDTSTSTGLGFTAKKLTINGTGSLLIKAGTTVTVQNQIVNNAGANAIIVENTGSLVQVNDAIPSPNSGVIKYNRQTNAISNLDYTYWSSPVAGFTLGGVSPNTQVDKFYSFNATTQAWKQETAATTMSTGVGYIIRGPQLSSYMSPNPPATYQATFTGVPYNGKYQISGLVANKLYLIGNPYASALDADTFIDGNLDVLEGALYFWTHNTPVSGNLYASSDYASYTRTGGVSTASTVGGITPTGKIASGQGFFAKSKILGLTNGDTTIDFSNTMRVGVGGITGNNSQFFRTTTSIEKNRIWLDLTNTQGAFKQTLVGYLTGATNEFDNIFDGESFNANQFVDFYSINESKKLVIQGRALPFDENDEVPLGYKSTIAGSLTISIGNTDGLFVDQNVYLEDMLTNTITDLKSESYTFNSAIGTFNDRFVLRYTTNTLGTNNPSIENSIIIYKSNGMLNVNSGNVIMDNVKVYDIQGRLIAEQKNVNGTTTSIKNLKATQQVLIVKVTTQDNKVVTKKVVN